MNQPTDLQIIRESQFFDEKWYVARYPDVTLSGLVPAEHYLSIGARIGRDPGPKFITSIYLDHNKAIAGIGLNPLVHFEQHGKPAGRWLRTGAWPDGVSQSEDTTMVDVVVPVHNALEDVQNCLTALVHTETGFTCRVIVVNDASNADTTAWLRWAAENLQSATTTFTLIELTENKGYTAAVNIGLKATSANYVVTLNSDTIVTPFWLDGLVNCLRSAPDLGIAGPLSNAASYQNVPTLYGSDKKFAINALPPGITPNSMAALVQKASTGKFLRTPFLNGFCYMIRREVIDKIGYMDEVAFPIGYGEENDYSIRAQDAGFGLAIADDTFVFHAKSKSFGTQRSVELSKAGRQALNAKHTAERVSALVAQMNDTANMDAVRARIQAALDAVQPLGHRTPRDWVCSQKVLFLLWGLPGGGGTHSVVQEVAAMRRMAVDARIAIRQEHVERFREAYRDIPDLDDLFVIFTASDILMVASRYDIVVATFYRTVRLLESIVRQCPWILAAYYIQDYEPWFYEHGSSLWHEAHESYALISGTVLFAKTDWIRRQIQSEHGLFAHKVQASLDHDVYHPASGGARSMNGHTITAMVRPHTPRRGARRTMELLKRIKTSLGADITVRIFGCETDSPAFQELPRDFDFQNLGVLTRPQVAALLQTTDVFVDLSDYQAFGRTAIEAMACGAISVVPKFGGTDEYAVDGVNALVVDPFDLDACYNRIMDVLRDTDLATRIQLAALDVASGFSPRRAAMSELLVLAPQLTIKRKSTPVPQRNRIALVPTGAVDRDRGWVISDPGYTRLVLPYQHDTLVSQFDTSISGGGSLPHPGSAEIAVLQRNLAEDSFLQFKEWHQQFRAAGGRIIYDIDDAFFVAKVALARGENDRNAAKVMDQVLTLAEAADVITVPTTQLAAQFAAFSGKVRIVGHRLDERLWKGVDGTHSPRKPATPKASGQIRIGYLGLPSCPSGMALVREALDIVQKRTKESIDIEIIEPFHKDPPPLGRRIVLPRPRGYAFFANWVQKVADWDIAILPLDPERSNLARSNLIFMELAALGVGIVCSDVFEAKELARHKQNCLVTDNSTEAWVNAFTQLIDDAALRQRLADTALADVGQKFTLRGSTMMYLDVLAASRVTAGKTTGMC